MAADDIDLLGIERGLVIAPAGCGKTQLIVNALRRHTGTKPILVLTLADIKGNSCRDYVKWRRAKGVSLWTARHDLSRY